MDNTDGVGQTLLEIAEASCCRFVIDSKKIRLPDIVHAIASHLNEDPISFALGAGADLSLIGTLRGAWNQSEARARFGDMVKIIGRVECGDGIYCDDRRDRRPVAVRGWNYFAGQ
jgi:thiamine monophosphate kinase